VDVRLDGERARASVLQEPAGFGEEVDAAQALAAAGLAPSEAAPDLPAQVVSTGLPTLIAPLAGAEALARAAPDPALLETLLTATGASTLYLVWSDTAAGRARARMFCNVVPGGEDPATGSAAGPLCAYLAERAGCARVEISQGVEMGRPSVLVAEMEGGRPRVGGEVVLVVEGTVLL
jgi:trans-2,3-dihydro-3-hydroxyanthranilate isomerase